MLPEVHGAVLDAARKLLRKRGIAAEKMVWDGLTLQEQSIYEKATAPLRAPAAAGFSLLEKIARQIGPDQTSALFAMGKYCAINRLTWWARLLVPFLPTRFVLQVFRRVWEIFFRLGIPQWEYTPDTTRARFVVRQNSAMPEALLEITRGFITGALTTIDAKQIEVSKPTFQALAWIWVVTWNYNE